MVWKVNRLEPHLPPQPPFNKDGVRREMIRGVIDHFPEWKIIALGMQDEMENPFDLFLVKPVIKMVKTIYGKDSPTPHEIVKPEKFQICAAVFIKKDKVELPLELRADLQGWINYLWVCNTPTHLLNYLNKTDDFV